MSNLIAQMKEQIDPLFARVIDVLDAEDNAYPMAFFSQLRIALANAEDEADVISMFFELSSAAFQGFVLGPQEAAAVDELLAACENVSHAMTASDQSSH
jgi:hypothetical protein